MRFADMRAAQAAEAAINPPTVTVVKPPLNRVERRRLMRKITRVIKHVATMPRKLRNLRSVAIQQRKDAYRVETIGKLTERRVALDMIRLLPDAPAEQRNKLKADKAAITRSINELAGKLPAKRRTPVAV
jgi:hypothetical protein